MQSNVYSTTQIKKNKIPDSIFDPPNPRSKIAIKCRLRKKGEEIYEIFRFRK